MGLWIQACAAGLVSISCLSLLPGSSTPANAGTTWFFDQLNPYTGAWKGRGFGRRKGSDEKEVVSCKGIHKWLKKGREFEQSYTCWGGDFAVSGSFRIKPGKVEGECLGEAMNGAKEVTGKIWGKIMETGELKVNMKKNFEKKITQASLVPQKNGSIVYSVYTPKEDGQGLRQILKITYKKMKKK